MQSKYNTPCYNLDFTWSCFGTMFLPWDVTREFWKNDLFMQALNRANPEGAVWPGFTLLVFSVKNLRHHLEK